MRCAWIVLATCVALAMSAEINFPGNELAGGSDGADGRDSSGLTREQRSPAGDDDDYEDDGDTEGRHLKHKIKRKFKPHKYGYGGLLNGLLGGYGGGYGHGGHHGGHHHGGFGGFGPDCRKLHGCGGFGGWQQQQQQRPIAAAIAGPGYGGWRPPGYGGWYGQRPGNAQSQAATWNFGPFQGSIGFAQAG